MGKQRFLNGVVKQSAEPNPTMPWARGRHTGSRAA